MVMQKSEARTNLSADEKKTHAWNSRERKTVLGHGVEDFLDLKAALAR